LEELIEKTRKQLAGYIDEKEVLWSMTTKFTHISMTFLAVKSFKNWITSILTKLERYMTKAQYNGGMDMKVVTPVQMREIDSYTINKVGIPGIVLMENAAVRVTDEILKDYGSLVNKNIVFIGR